MPKSGSFLHDRSLWTYYALFLSGSVVLVYQALGLGLIGDSVNFLCILFLINGLHVRRWINIFENTFLVTLGYILPLLIRNSIKLSYVEAPSIKEFTRLALMSSLTTALLGLLFTSLGFLLKHFSKKAYRLSRGKITTNSGFKNE
ncbi:MAG TPA: hypothetical protein VF412_02770 [Bdellovibrio sp.]|uniref:hypothetical protein n=1 Tax=Bdellovibrio sp. TaxID=28201 RepID=UPI002EE31DC1